MFIALFCIAQNEVKTDDEYPNYGTVIDSPLRPIFVQEGDTMDFNFYPEYPKDIISVEFRPHPEIKGDLYYAKVFRIKNIFSHDIYLQSFISDCLAFGFKKGVLKPGEEAYSSVYFFLNGKKILTRTVNFRFWYCPGTEEAEYKIIQTYFKGKRLPEEEKEKEKK